MLITRNKLTIIIALLCFFCRYFLLGTLTYLTSSLVSKWCYAFMASFFLKYAISGRYWITYKLAKLVSISTASKDPLKSQDGPKPMVATQYYQTIDTPICCLDPTWYYVHDKLLGPTYAITSTITLVSYKRLLRYLKKNHPSWFSIAS